MQFFAAAAPGDCSDRCASMRNQKGVLNVSRSSFWEWGNPGQVKILWHEILAREILASKILALKCK